jgi:hypothetical protein
MTRAGNGEGNSLRCGVRKIAECNPHTSASRREHFFGLCPVNPLQTTFLGEPLGRHSGGGIDTQTCDEKPSEYGGECLQDRRVLAAPGGDRLSQETLRAAKQKYPPGVERPREQPR